MDWNPAPERGRTRYKSRLGYVLLVLALLTVAIPAAYFLEKFTVSQLIEGYVQQIADAFGLSEFYAVAITALLFVPVLVVARFLLSFSARRRLVGLVAMSGFFAVHYTLLGFASRNQFFTRDGQPLKCYVASDSGIRFHNRSGVDPYTGRDCRSVTREILPRLRILEAKRALGQGIRPLNLTEDLQFFSSLTGEPVIWYYREANGEYVFYDVPTFNPRSGSPLEPVSPSVVSEFRKKRAVDREAAQRQHQGELLAKQAADNERRREMRDRELLALRSMFPVRAVNSPPFLVLWSLGPRTRQDPLDQEAAVSLRASLQAYASGTDQDAAVLDPAFSDQGYLERALEGDLSVLQSSGALERTRYVGLGKVSAACRASSVPDVTSCEVSVIYKHFDNKGRLARSGLLRETGAGLSSQEAVVRATELVLERNTEVLIHPRIQEE